MTYKTAAHVPLEPLTADHRNLALGAHVTFRLNSPAAAPTDPVAALTEPVETPDPYPTPQLLGHSVRAQRSGTAKGRALPHWEYTPLTSNHLAVSRRHESPSRLP